MGWWDSFWPVLAALIPSIGLLFLFWVLMKHILEGDRRERAAQREWEAERERLLHKEPLTDPGQSAPGGGE
jgi:hypothetical protein